MKTKVDALAAFQTQLFMLGTKRAVTFTGKQARTLDAPRADLMRPVKFNAAGWSGNKPHGGLWTSTRLGRGYSDWVNWCGAEMPEWIGDRYALRVDAVARVLHVWTREDVEALPKFARTDHYKHKQGIDFEALSRVYDGVHFADDDLVWSYLEDDLSCECTFWFRWAFESVTLDRKAPAITRRGEQKRRYYDFSAQYEDLVEFPASPTPVR